MYLQKKNVNPKICYIPALVYNCCLSISSFTYPWDRQVSDPSHALNSGVSV